MAKMKSITGSDDLMDKLIMYVHGTLPEDIHIEMEEIIKNNKQLIFLVESVELTKKAFNFKSAEEQITHEKKAGEKSDKKIREVIKNITR